MNNKPKFFLLTTVPMSLNFFRNQIQMLNEFYDITLISSSGKELTKISRDEGVKGKSIDMKREISLFTDIISLLNLIFYFIKEKPYVVHCNTPKASLLGILSAFISRVPHRIYYIHGLRYEGVSGLKRRLLILMEKLTCICATDIIAVSFGIKEIVEKELTSKSVNIIHNGSVNGMLIFDFENIIYDIQLLKANLNILEDDFVYGFVGRIVGDKGINELIDSFDEINQSNVKTKLLLVGQYEDKLDPLSDKTKSIIRDNKNIIEVGFQEDVKPFLSIMDVFISPSYREGFGLTLLEANLMKKPVIASKITGYSEIVEEGKNGFFINARDKLSLLSMMKDVYEMKDELKLMGEDCFNIVKEKYNHKDVLNEAVNYYKKISN